MIYQNCTIVPNVLDNTTKRGYNINSYTTIRGRWNGYLSHIAKLCVKFWGVSRDALAFGDSIKKPDKGGFSAMPHGKKQKKNSK